MKTSLPLRPFSAFLACLVLPGSIALAHPGHEHADIPSVVRHPFASVEHVVVTFVVVATLALVAVLAARSARRQGSTFRR